MCVCVALGVYVGAVGVMAVSNLRGGEGGRERALALCSSLPFFSGTTRVVHFYDFAAKFYHAWCKF